MGNKPHYSLWPQQGQIWKAKAVPKRSNLGWIFLGVRGREEAANTVPFSVLTTWVLSLQYTNKPLCTHPAGYHSPPPTRRGKMYTLWGLHQFPDPTLQTSLSDTTWLSTWHGFCVLNSTLFPNIVHYIWPERYGPWSKVLHYEEDSVQFGKHVSILMCNSWLITSSLQSEETVHISLVIRITV